MADSTMVDVSKMKVIDLRKELKSRGLASTGDKAELIARLQAVMAQDEAQDDHADIHLSSDEDIDSDGVLDEDDKSHNDILEDAIDDTLNEELALNEKVTPDEKPKASETIPQRTLKRKFTDIKENSVEKTEQKESRKIVLNRAISMTSTEPKSDEKSELQTDSMVSESTLPKDSNKIRITAECDSKTRMEMRAKRFGLPVKMTDAERKEARKQRFGQTAGTGTALSMSGTPTLSENLDKLKQRAERFGQSVSKIMSDIETKERLEKRKAKFGTSK